MKAKQRDLQLELPDFMRVQSDIINSLQERIDKLNRDFNIEKACKNQVYEFLFKSNHFDEYVEFNKQNPVKY